MISSINKKILKFGFEVVEHTNALLAYWDKNLICRFANHSYIEWFGISPSDMINKMHIRDVLKNLYQKNLPYIKGALQGKMQLFERDIQIASGEIRNSIATYYPDVKNNKIIGFFVHVADVTYIKQKFENEVSYVEDVHFPANDDSKIILVEKTLRKLLLKDFPGIKTLSKTHFVSETKLKSRFKELYGKSIFSYFRHLQMNLAEHYLNEKKLSKKQISVMLNFSNPSNFSSCYKNYLHQKAFTLKSPEVKQASNEQYKIFVQQAPYAIAMLDENFCFIAVSEKWETDFKLPKNYAGLSFNELLPEFNIWAKLFSQCFAGETNKGEDLFFLHSDNIGTWLKWTIQSWYTINKIAGGVLIFTEDTTEAKLKTEENEKLFEIFSKTSEIARIGAWKRNFTTNTSIWSNVIKEILEVPGNYQATFASGINFYKKGEDRNLIKRLVRNAIKFGKPFDVKVQLITAKGNQKQVRVIGYPIFKNGKCEKLLGTIQDMSDFA